MGDVELLKQCPELVLNIGLLKAYLGTYSEWSDLIASLEEQHHWYEKIVL